LAVGGLAAVKTAAGKSSRSAFAEPVEFVVKKEKHKGHEGRKGYWIPMNRIYKTNRND
jgi:hypothetical protein